MLHAILKAFQIYLKVFFALQDVLYAWFPRVFHKVDTTLGVAGEITEHKIFQISLEEGTSESTSKTAQG